MLINATQPEELRVALVDGQSIYDFDIEQPYKMLDDKYKDIIKEHIAIKEEFKKFYFVFQMGATRRQF